MQNDLDWTIMCNNKLINFTYVHILSMSSAAFWHSLSRAFDSISGEAFPECSHSLKHSLKHSEGLWLPFTAMFPNWGSVRCNLLPKSCHFVSSKWLSPKISLISCKWVIFRTVQGCIIHNELKHIIFGSTYHESFYTAGGQKFRHLRPRRLSRTVEAIEYNWADGCTDQIVHAQAYTSITYPGVCT